MTKLTTTTKNSYYACIVLLLTIISTNAQICNPGIPLEGQQAPQGQCDPNGADCCKAGDTYPTYECSPPVTSNTNAVLTLNSFASGGDGSGPSECDGQYHSDDTPVVALSTGWYEEGSRCGKEIIIYGNGQTTKAMVVDECDSRNGCDEEHGYQVPSKNNIVDASKAVWSALGVSSDSGQMQITWSDA